MEIWKKLNGFDIEYEVSNHGQIRNTKTKRILKLKYHIIRKGKYTVVKCNLRKNKKSSTQRVSRLVLSTFNFIDNPEEYHVDHIDFNPTNNSLSNLRWLTPEENSIRTRNQRTKEYYEEQLRVKDQIIADLMSRL